LKLCELDYWNGTFPNVADGMIPDCMEFMHALLQLPCMLIQASRTWTAPSFAADDMILLFQNNAECQEFVIPHTNEMDLLFIHIYLLH
jgi:hypothetical protein